MDSFGPWYLEGSLKLPECATRVNFSTHHEKANITVSHILKIVLRVERGDDDFLDSKGKRKVRSFVGDEGTQSNQSLCLQLWDVIIEVC